MTTGQSDHSYPGHRMAPAVEVCLKMTLATAHGVVSNVASEDGRRHTLKGGMGALTLINENSGMPTF